MPANDVETLFTGAQRPRDTMARELAELVWNGLPMATKTSLGDTLDNFLEEFGLKATSKSVASAYEKRLALWRAHS